MSDVESKKRGVVLDDSDIFAVGYYKTFSVTSWRK